MSTTAFPLNCVALLLQTPRHCGQVAANTLVNGNKDWSKKGIEFPEVLTFTLHE